jgi:hypothetical protein
MSRRRAWAVVSGLLAAAGLLVASTAEAGLLARVLASQSAPWLLGRAGGLTAYLLLVLLVLLGLWLSHPAARRLARPSLPTRIALHVGLAVFTLVFTLLHVAALVVDPWAHVGWAGALLPLASAYRPVGVTLGVIAVWAGIVTGVTAALAGRGLGRIWWPVHKVALLVLVLAWAHGLVAGSDTAALRPIYLGTGLAVTAAALARYLAPSPADGPSPAVGKRSAAHGASRVGSAGGEHA